MFTGIIEELGHVLEVTPLAAGARITIACRNVLADAATGASIAVNGTCLTALDLKPESFAADLSPETLARTSLGQLEPGSLVNLERPLRFNGRLDGHFVLGTRGWHGGDHSAEPSWQWQLVHCESVPRTHSLATSSAKLP